MARYGRMRLGRCVKTDLGYLGCAVDVRHLVDSRCTGRRHCLLPVGDEELRITKPCPPDVTWYLEVQYICVKGKIDLIMTGWCEDKFIEYILNE